MKSEQPREEREEELRMTDTQKATQTRRRPHHIDCKVIVSIWNTKNPLTTGALEKPCHHFLSFMTHICHVTTQVVRLQIYAWQNCVGWWLGLGELYSRASVAELFPIALSCRKLDVYQLESGKLS